MSELPRRVLGRTGFQTTVLGFGASMTPFRWTSGHPITVEEAGQTLNAVLDAGINYIDTAPGYGKSEEYIGETISHRRDEYFLATKCGSPINLPAASGKSSLVSYSRQNIVAGVEQSLRRMRTDHIDALQVFGTYGGNISAAQIESEHVVETLRDLQAQGKIRFIGISSTLPELAEHVQLEVFDLFQIPYNALERESEAFITMAAANGAGTVIRGATAKGVLSRSMAAPSPEVLERTWSRFEQARLYELLEGSSRSEFMLRYVMSHPDVSTIIIGTFNPSHLADNVVAIEKGPLPAEILAEAARRLDAVEHLSEAP